MPEHYNDPKKKAERKKKRDEIAKEVSKKGILGELNKRKKK